MGLKSFLKKQGFIEEEEDKIKPEVRTSEKVPQATTGDTPVFFPMHSPVPVPAVPVPSVPEAADPSFVAPLQKTKNEPEPPDPAFVKFFEDELVKANLAGPDYFEFRQLLTKTQQKMTAKGVTAPEVVLQAVLMSFEAQDISPAKLIDAAKHYKEVIRQKNDDFLKGAAAEKNNQLKKRQAVLQSHEEAIKKIQQQLQQLELQRKQLDESLSKEKTQLEIDKSLGQEGIEKIERAERSISLAHSYIQSTIDNDINRLQSV